MKMHLLKNSLILLSLLAITNLTAAATKVWKGTTSSDWNNTNNWTGGTPAAGDDVTIGVTAYTGVDPVVTASTTCKSITFGPNNAGSATKPISLTVNGTGIVLTVTTTITQNYTAGTAGSSHGTNYGTYTTSLLGTGAIMCTGNFVIGNTTVAPASNAANIFIISSQITQLTIGGDLLMNAVGNNSSSAQNYPAFNLDNNKMTLYGQFNFTATGNPASGTYAGTNGNYIGIAIFCANNNSNITTLELVNNAAIKNFVAGCCVDFDNKGAGRSITIYDSPSGSQRVYTDDDYPYTGSVPDTYINLVLSGNSAKVFDGDVVNIGADLTVSGGAVDWNSNDPDINVSGDVISSTTITEGKGTVAVDGDWQNNTGSTITGNTTTASTTVGGDITNSGVINCGAENFIFDGDYTANAGASFTAGTGIVYFSGSTAQTLVDRSTNGTVFNKVTFNGSSSTHSTVTMTAGVGNFGVSPSGILTMTSPAKLIAGSSSAAYLTLNSDATGSAIVAAITGSSSITGYVNVERFIKGSNSGTTHDLTQRGYRLLSSTVYTGTDASTSHVSDFQYLLNSVYISGAAGGGFNVTTTTNPSIYLFREDDMPPPANGVLFTTGYNWKGVAKINNSPAYNFGTQAKNTTANINNATYTLPVGNGFLFFFRGSKVAGGNGSTAGTQLTAPFNYPDDVTLTQTGNLNTGTIAVKLWFAADASLGNNFSFTSSLVNSGTSTLRGGFTLVGNPYPSTINWEKYNNTHASGAITGGGATSATKLPSTIWVYNVVSKQFDTYRPLQGSDVTSERPGNNASLNYTGSASNFIASGQGFFVKATAAGQNLTFGEAAKVSSQTAPATLLNLMGRPKELANAPQTGLRLKLVKDSVNTDDIVINLDNSASAKFADGEDAEDMGGNGALVSLGSFSSDSVQVAINTLPFPSVKPQSIRLLVNAVSSGTYQLTSPQLNNFSKLYSVWLKDAFTNDSLKLQANSSYQFTIDKSNPATFGGGRFTVVIRQDTANAYRLLSFTAAKTDKAVVQLVWKTINEQNYTNFTVERSTDGGKTFSVVGGLQGTGAGLYSILDNNPVQGQNLYRLKQEDLNNNITYSYVVAIQYSSMNNNAGNIHVYPNPAIHTINLDVIAKTDAKASYSIVVTNSSGVAIKQATTTQASWQSGVSELMPGTYLVRVINNNDKSLVGQSKFVKL